MSKDKSITIWLFVSDVKKKESLYDIRYFIETTMRTMSLVNMNVGAI